jgi:lysophospholipase L1-like esterase
MRKWLGDPPRGALMTPAPVPASYVALGDSFTEGLDDPSTSGTGRYRGWADRLAEEFAARDPAFRYANLAVRGRKIEAIVAGQVPSAIELAPELVSLSGGTNDVLRPTVDLDAVTRTFEDAVRRLRANGSQVMLFQSVDPTARSRLIGRTLGRIKALTTMVEEVSERHQCVLVRLWGAPVFSHPQAWSADRLHLSPDGHARVAGAAMEALGLGDHGWADDFGAYPVQARRERLVADLHWARTYLGPWVGRRLRGVSSGDAVTAKYPELGPVGWKRDETAGSSAG